MTDYYKALRPDGTDFATGKTRPVLGEWMPRIKGRLIMCERGYHVSAAVGETLCGGSWPCLLARVEIPDGSWKQSEHKLLVPAYRVIEWLPPHLALGPNGEEVAAMIEHVTLVTPTAWAAAPTARPTPWGASPAAWDAARDAARDAATHAARDAAGDAAWVAARDAPHAARDAPRVASGAAALALCMRDLISAEHFDMLYGPWKRMTEEIESVRAVKG